MLNQILVLMDTTTISWIRLRKIFVEMLNVDWTTNIGSISRSSKYY